MAARFPHTVREHLLGALTLRQRRDTVRLEAHMDRLLATPWRALPNHRLASNLYHERDALFTFLYCPGLEATNWRAEQAARPMVVTRKA